MNNSSKKQSIIFRTASLILAVLMTFTLVSCNNEGAKTADTTSAKTEETGNTEPAVFEDEVFAGAVAAALNKKEASDLTLGDLEKVKVLFYSSPGISIAYDEYLNVFQQITDAKYPTPEMEYPSMLQGEFENPQTSFNLHDLAMFKNVEYLVFNSYSGEVDISSLSILKKLRHLVFFMGSTMKLDGVADLEGLETLEMFSGGLSDLSPLNGITGLKTLLIGNTKKITDWSPISTLTGLKYLFIDSCGFSDTASLSTLTELTRLQLTNNAVTDFTPITKLTKLQMINMNGNDLTSVAGIEALAGTLNELKLNTNNIVDVSPMKKLENCRLISLAQNNNLEGIDELGEALPDCEILIPDSSAPTPKASN